MTYKVKNKLKFENRNKSFLIKNKKYKEVHIDENEELKGYVVYIDGVRYPVKKNEYYIGKKGEDALEKAGWDYSFKHGLIKMLLFKPKSVKIKEMKVFKENKNKKFFVEETPKQSYREYVSERKNIEKELK